LFGYGYKNMKPYDEEFEEAITLHIDEISQVRKKILITHTPPSNTNPDIIIGRHVGNKSFSKYAPLSDL